MSEEVKAPQMGISEQQDGSQFLVIDGEAAIAEVFDNRPMALKIMKRWNDYAVLQRRVAELEAERDGLRDKLRVVSSSYGDLPEAVTNLIEPHVWDNMTASEQRDWAVKQLAAEKRQREVAKRALEAEWTNLPPTEQGEYWHWDGNPDAAPFPLSVMWSGTAQKCFVCIGDHPHAPFCDDFGGWWMRIHQPPQPIDAARQLAQPADAPKKPWGFSGYLEVLPERNHLHDYIPCHCEDCFGSADALCAKCHEPERSSHHDAAGQVAQPADAQAEKLCSRDVESTFDD